MAQTLAALALCAVVAGCAAAPPVPAPAPVVGPVERVTIEPAAAAPAVGPPPAPAPAPMVEWPPVEPVAVVPRTVPASAPAAVAQAQVTPEPAAPAPAAPVTPQVAAVPPPAPAPPPPPPPQVVVVQEASPEEREFVALLADLQRYAGLAGDEMRRELAAQTQAMNRTRADAVRIRVAVLHTLTRQGTQDDQRALALFETVTKGNPGSTALKQLAAVLSVQVAERLRAVREEQARSEAAIQKLEALRAMERSLMRDRLRSGGGGGAGSGGGN